MAAQAHFRTVDWCNLVAWVAKVNPWNVSKKVREQTFPQLLDWDFRTMQKQSAVGQSKKRERAESAPQASVAEEELVGSAQVRLPAHLRSAQGPASFASTFDLEQGALAEASVRAVSGERGE